MQNTEPISQEMEEEYYKQSPYIKQLFAKKVLSMKVPNLEQLTMEDLQHRKHSTIEKTNRLMTL